MCVRSPGFGACALAPHRPILSAYAAVLCLHTCHRQSSPVASPPGGLPARQPRVGRGRPPGSASSRQRARTGSRSTPWARERECTKHLERDHEFSLNWQAVHDPIMGVERLEECFHIPHSTLVKIRTSLPFATGVLSRWISGGGAQVLQGGSKRFVSKAVTPQFPPQRHESRRVGAG